MSYLSVSVGPTLIIGGILLVGVGMALALGLSRRRAMRVCSIVGPLSLLFSQVPMGSITALAASPPPLTWSRYVGTLNMYTMGCTQGKTSDSQGQQQQIAILSFGDPDTGNNGTYGAYDNRLGGFVSIPQIQTAVESYMQGFWDCTVPGSHSFMEVAPGVTNHGGLVTASHGSAWGAMVGNLESWIQTKRYGSQLFAEGSVDVEPKWSSARVAEAWTDAFNATNQEYFDFGSADGCPPFGSCANGWSQSDVYYVAWGEPAARAVPEIYTEDGGQANEWESISLWGASNGTAGPISFAAALSTYQACKDIGSNCSGIDNTPAQSWSQLTSAMNSNSSTSTSTVGPIPFSTEMSYQTS